MFPYLRILFLSLVATAATAQTKLFTFEDIVLNPTLSPQGVRQLNWIPASNQFAYVVKAKGKDFLVRGEATKTTRDTLASVEAIGTAVQAAGGDALKALPAIQWSSPTSFYFTHMSGVFRYDITQKKAERLTTVDKDAENTDLEPKTFSVAYTKENNLFIARKGGETLQVTNESNKGIVNGQAAHRSEFGITKGTFWSPTGAALAFFRQDESMVTDYPLVDVDQTPAALKNIKYPMAGGKSHHVTVGIYKTWNKTTTYLKTGEPAEQYLTNVTWSPDEKFVFVAVVNRGQNEMKLNMYEASSGNLVRTLFEEKSDKWIEPEHGPIFITGNNEEFLWFSKRDGYQHLYRYDLKGKMLNQATIGAFNISDFVGFAPKGDKAVVLGATNQGLERQAFLADIKKGTLTQITKEKGLHTVQLSPNGNYLSDSYTSTTVPRITQVIDMTGKVVQTLLKAENPIKDYKVGELTLFTLKADDGTPLNARVIKPIDFDAKKKYPVIVYLYGGSHAQLVSESWRTGADRWMELMAQKGYVVFTLDNRGSANRGLKFEQATHRQLATAELSDQLKGVEWLKSQPYVDASRMGIYGWSFGGFMTTSMMLKHPDVFKAGVAGGPVIDWKFYEIMYTERYMDTPQENPEGYAANSLLDKIKNLKGRLLLIHGTADNVVVWQHSLSMVKKAVDEGVINLDYFVYPGHEHNVRGKDRVHLMRKITQYFEDHL